MKKIISIKKKHRSCKKTSRTSTKFQAYLFFLPNWSYTKCSRSKNIPNKSNVTQIEKMEDIYDLVNHYNTVHILNGKRIGQYFYKHYHSFAIHPCTKTPSNLGDFNWLNYLTEQNRSINYHRYGNLMGKTWNEP